MQELDGLALEYQAYYGTARRDVDVSHFINNPNASGVIRVFGSRLQKKSSDPFLFELRSLLKNGSNPLLVSDDRVEPLAQELTHYHRPSWLYPVLMFAVAAVIFFAVWKG